MPSWLSREWVSMSVKFNTASIFILASDFSVKKSIDHSTEYPHKILDTPQGCLWYKKDNKFFVPKGKNQLLVYWYIQVGGLLDPQGEIPPPSPIMTSGLTTLLQRQHWYTWSCSKSRIAPGVLHCHSWPQRLSWAADTLEVHCKKQCLEKVLDGSGQMLCPRWSQGRKWPLPLLWSALLSHSLQPVQTPRLGVLLHFPAPFWSHPLHLNHRHATSRGCGAYCCQDEHFGPAYFMLQRCLSPMSDHHPEVLHHTTELGVAPKVLC